MEKDIIRFDSKEELELYLFKEIPELSISSEDIINLGKISSFLNLSRAWVMIVKDKIDDHSLCLEENRTKFHLITEDFNFKIGDVLVVNNNSDPNSNKHNVILVERGIDFDVLRERLYRDNIHIRLSDFKEAINSKLIEEVIKKIKEDMEEERKRREEEQKEAKEKEIDLQKLYEGGDEISISGDRVKGNKFIFDDYKVVTKENYNKFLRFNQVQSLYGLHSLYKILIDVKRDFTVYKTNKLALDVKFNKDSIGATINGVKVRTMRVYFVLGKLKDDEFQNEDKIELLNNLTKMKFDLIQTSEISVDRKRKETGGGYSGSERYDNIKIPIEILPDLKANSFEVKLFDKTATIQWQRLKDIFFKNGRTIFSNLDIRDLIKLADGMGMGKEDIYSIIQKISIVNSLGESKEND